jgi:hypothetical protein
MQGCVDCPDNPLASGGLTFRGLVNYLVAILVPQIRKVNIKFFWPVKKHLVFNSISFNFHNSSGVYNISVLIWVPLFGTSRVLWYCILSINVGLHRFFFVQKWVAQHVAGRQAALLCCQRRY